MVAGPWCFGHRRDGFGYGVRLCTITTVCGYLRFSYTSSYSSLFLFFDILVVDDTTIRRLQMSYATAHVLNIFRKISRKLAIVTQLS